MRSKNNYLSVNPQNAEFLWKSISSPKKIKFPPFTGTIITSREQKTAERPTIGQKNIIKLSS